MNHDPTRDTNGRALDACTGCKSVHLLPPQPTAFTNGQRVKVAIPTDRLDSWSHGEDFQGATGTVACVKGDLAWDSEMCIDYIAASVLVTFDTPIPQHPTPSMATGMHFDPSELVALEVTE